jgi:hypothetical protein
MDFRQVDPPDRTAPASSRKLIQQHQPGGYLCEFADAQDVVFRDEVIERALTYKIKPLFPGEDYWEEWRGGAR